MLSIGFFFQAEDGIRSLVRSRGLGDVYKRQRQQRGSPLVAEQGAEGLQHVESVLQKGPAVLHSILSLIHI